MKRVIKALEIFKDGIVNKKYDAVIGVFGEEGTGKSYFDLTLIDEWIKLFGREPTAEDIKYMNLKLSEWGEQLAECKPHDIIVLDEGGKLSSKRVMSKLNQAVNEAYQIIRGDHLFSIITLPSLWELDSFFTKRRMRGAFFVYKRGRVAFWDRNRLRKIIALNENRLIKNMWLVKPNFYDTYKNYDGALKEPYDEKKKEFMKYARKELSETIKELTERNPTKEKSEKIPKSTLAILEYAEKNGFTNASRQFGISRDTLYEWKKKQNLASCKD
jgi:hypothetical protein